VVGLEDVMIVVIVVVATAVVSVVAEILDEVDLVEAAVVSVVAAMKIVQCIRLRAVIVVMTVKYRSAQPVANPCYVTTVSALVVRMIALHVENSVAVITRTAVPWVRVLSTLTYSLPS
jgi:hypothetical protein